MSKNTALEPNEPKAPIRQARQGDILVEVVDSLPSKVRKTDRSIVARGEVRGHAHIIDEHPAITIYEDAENPLIMFVSVGEDVKPDESLAMRHLHETSKKWTKDHHPIGFEPGKTYRITRQKAYDPYAKVKQLVLD